MKVKNYYLFENRFYYPVIAAMLMLLLLLSL